jgi:5'-3' exonuclease
VGDTADGIPGLAGFGAKTSAVLLNHYTTLEQIPDDPEQWEVKVRGAPRLGATLAAGRQEVSLYKRLATLRFDVPLIESFDDLKWRGAPRAEYEAFIDSIGGTAMRPSKYQ